MRHRDGSACASAADNHLLSAIRAWPCLARSALVIAHGVIERVTKREEKDRAVEDLMVSPAERRHAGGLRLSQAFLRVDDPHRKQLFQQLFSHLYPEFVARIQGLPERGGAGKINKGRFIRWSTAPNRDARTL